MEPKLRADGDQIDAPWLLRTLVAILLFADYAHMSYSSTGLQDQLDGLAQFCALINVNVNKTKIVVNHATRGLACAMGYPRNSARKAMYALSCTSPA